MHSNGKRIDLEAGTIEYSDLGTGPVLLFVHGVFVNGGLWRRVVPELRNDFRSIVPTLPLGAHRIPMHAEADLSPLGLAKLIVAFIERLDLHDVTLVANDTGGALCQLVLAHHAERIADVVFTNCDAFEYFPPASLKPLYVLARIRGSFGMFAATLGNPGVASAFFATVAKTNPDPAYLAETFAPFVADAAVRRDLQKTLSVISKRDTLAAAATFASFAGNVRVVWGKNDIFFPVKLGERLAHAFPDSTFELVDDCRTFVPEDAPERLVASIRALARKGVPTPDVR